MTSREHSHPKTLVITVEGFSAPLLGAFGSNVARTPWLDRLASRGVVLDQCSLDSVHRESQLRSLWTGKHAMQSRSNIGPSLWQACEAASIPCCFLTDCERAGELAESMGCRDATAIALTPSVEPVEDWLDCNLLELFTFAAEVLSEQSGLVWIHSSGLHLPWDAPIDLRQQFTDPDDPSPPSSVTPPSIELSSNTDPDEVIGWGQVAAAQATVMDEGLATLQATLASRHDTDDWAWLFASIRGIPLGEHGRVGWPQDAKNAATATYAEELMSPCIIVPRNAATCDSKESHDPDAEKIAVKEIATRGPSVCSRRAELFQLPDLAATLLSLLELDSSSGEDDLKLWGQDILDLEVCDSPPNWSPQHQLACVQSEDRLWIRCPAWSATVPLELVENASSPTNSSCDDQIALDRGSLDDRCNLFVKPEDRWEVNNVCDRRLDILAALIRYGKSFLDAVDSGQRTWPDLPQELTNLLR